MVRKANESKKKENTKKTKAKLLVNIETLESIEGSSEKKWEVKKGRPQKFDPELAIQLMEEEIESYLRNRKKEGRYFEMLPTNDNGGVTLRGKPFMTLGVVALMCGVDIDTFIEHCNAKNDDGSIKNEQLFGSYKRFKNIGQIQLLEGGMAGAYNSNIVTFLGNVNYGMIPKTQVEQSVEIKSMDNVYSELDKLHAAEQQRVEAQKQSMLERKARLDAMEKEE